MKIVTATKNAHKLTEIKKKLDELNNIQLLSLLNYDNIPVIEETGTTFAENALIKAKTVAAITGEIALADDSGLCVDALDGRPGIFSARYGGSDLNDTDRYNLLLKEMQEIPDIKRTAHFTCIIAVFDPKSNVEYIAEGSCEGVITDKPLGTNGFGYDPVFWVPEYNKTMAQLSLEIKNRISHRARALEKTVKIIQEITTNSK